MRAPAPVLHDVELEVESATAGKTANMCFHLIPDLKVVHQGGVVFSESIVVTERGHEPLTAFPQEIFFR